MKSRNLLATGAEWCGVLLLVVLALPVLAVVAFLLRFAVLGVVAVGVAGVIVGYCVLPPVRRWANQAVRSVGGHH